MRTVTIQNSTTTFAGKNAIDEKVGIISGMSVITIGEAKGHGIFIDAESLKTCLAATKSHPDGVVCKADHGTGFFEVIGTLKNFRIDGEKLRGDLHLLKSHPRFASIIELATKMPNATGLSISFSYTPEVIDEEVFIRVLKLSSIDLVDGPAANTGMFSAPRNDLATLTAAFIAAEGPDGAQRIAGLHPSEARDRMERALHLGGFSVPSYDFSHVTKRYGAPKPLVGLRRVEVSRGQERIESALTRMR